MILDLSAGYRHVWHDKERRDVIFVDRRPECKPTVICDTRALPFPSGGRWDLILFDPPHRGLKATSVMAHTYGVSENEDVLSTILGTAREAARVSAPGTLMAFKWNDCRWPFMGAIAIMGQWWCLLFGHNMARASKAAKTTTWAMLVRL